MCRWSSLGRVFDTRRPFSCTSNQLVLVDRQLFPGAWPMDPRRLSLSLLDGSLPTPECRKVRVSNDDCGRRDDFF
jgi:hypothetical protein